MLIEVLKAWPDLVGFYNAGGANSSLASILRKHPHGRDIFFVGHELIERSAVALRDSAMSVVLDQAPGAQAHRALDLMLARLGLVSEPVPNDPIRFATITRENL